MQYLFLSFFTVWFAPFSSIFCLFLHKTLMPQEQVVIQAMLIRKTRMHATATKGQVPWFKILTCKTFLGVRSNFWDKKLSLFWLQYFKGQFYFLRLVHYAIHDAYRYRQILLLFNGIWKVFVTAPRRTVVLMLKKIRCKCP